MTMQCNDNYSQSSVTGSALFDNKLVRKSLHNETNFNKYEFTENSVNSPI